MQRLDGVVELIERHERGDTNLGGRNHQHVDALIAQGLEELGGQTGMGLHANAHHGHLAYGGVHIEGVVAQHFLLVEQCVLNLLDGRFGHGEGDVRSADGCAGN